MRIRRSIGGPERGQQQAALTCKMVAFVAEIARGHPIWSVIPTSTSTTRTASIFASASPTSSACGTQHSIHLAVYPTEHSFHILIRVSYSASHYIVVYLLSQLYKSQRRIGCHFICQKFLQGIVLYTTGKNCLELFIGNRSSQLSVHSIQSSRKLSWRLSQCLFLR